MKTFTILDCKNCGAFNSELDTFIDKRLRAMAARPQAFAATKEAFAANVHLLLEIAGCPNSIQVFYFAIPAPLD